MESNTSISQCHKQSDTNSVFIYKVCIKERHTLFLAEGGNDRSFRIRNAHRRPSICRRIAILPRPSRAPPPRAAAGPARLRPASRRLSRILSAPERTSYVLPRRRRGKNDRSCRIRNDRISWPASGPAARIPPPYSAGPKLRRHVRLFCSLLRRQTCFVLCLCDFSTRSSDRVV